MKEKIKQALASRQKQRINEQKLTSSAVLIPLFCKNGEYHVLFTQRSNSVAYHKGQVSFPGGTYSEGDSSPLDTALRESWEEIGLESKDVEILGELDDFATVSGFIISSFVGLIPYPYSFRENCDEIGEIFDMPVSALLDESNVRQEHITVSALLDGAGVKREDVSVSALIDKSNLGQDAQIAGNETISVYFYEHGGRVVWGATARILKQFLDILQSLSEAQG